MIVIRISTRGKISTAVKPRGVKKKNLTSEQRSGEIGVFRLRAKRRDGDAPRPSQPGEEEWVEEGWRRRRRSGWGREGGGAG